MLLLLEQDTIEIFDRNCRDLSMIDGGNIGNCLITINEQILKFAQNYPTNFKTASSDAPFFMNWCRLPIRSILT